ncbi:MAG: hypothetical protein ACRES7_03250 [Gammaproteobacteria bacterium]
MSKKDACLFYRSALQLLLLSMVTTACAMDLNPRANLQPGDGTWTTGCLLSNGETLGVAMQGLSRLRIATPCPQLNVTSQYRGTGTGTLPEATEFNGILAGQIGDWSWRILGTSAVVNAFPATNTVAPPEYDGKPYGPVVSWPGMFDTLQSVYRYVLDAPPPPSGFSLYFFPEELSVDRTGKTPTQDSLVRSFYLPFDVSPQAEKNGKPRLNPAQRAYTQAFQVVCAEYMHELFFTKRLKPMNMLTHSVADGVSCTGAALLAFRSDPHFAITFAPADSLDAASAKAVAKKQNDVDHLAFLLGAKNIANLLGGDTKAITVHATDTATVLKILQLARAMLQDPVDLTYQLYPLKRVESQPAYAATSAPPASGG